MERQRVCAVRSRGRARRHIRLRGTGPCGKCRTPRRSRSRPIRPPRRGGVPLLRQLHAVPLERRPQRPVRHPAAAFRDRRARLFQLLRARRRNMVPRRRPFPRGTPQARRRTAGSNGGRRCPKEKRGGYSPARLRRDEKPGRRRRRPFFEKDFPFPRGLPHLLLLFRLPRRALLPPHSSPHAAGNLFKRGQEPTAASSGKTATMWPRSRLRTCP